MKTTEESKHDQEIRDADTSNFSNREWIEARKKVQDIIDKDPKAHPFLKSDSNWDKMLRAIKRSCDKDIDC